jgi:hypothetical protein
MHWLGCRVDLSGRIPRGLLPMILAITLLAACSNQPGNSEPVDVAVRVYVDRDASGTWSDGDIPLPDITVSLDGESTAATDATGLAEFQSVSRLRHALALDEGDVAELESHALVCGSISQTVQLAEDTEIGFCFTARGFLEVDVEEQKQGE